MGDSMIKLEWDFSSFFKSYEEFLEDFEKISGEIDELKNKFKEFSLDKKLKLYYELGLQIEKMVTYTELNSDLDLADEKIMANKNEVYLLKQKISSFLEIINQEILDSDKSWEELITFNPLLKPYKMHIYEVKRCEKHLNNSSLVKENTLQINKLNDLYNIIQKIENEYPVIVIDGKRITVTAANFGKYLKNSKDSIRKKVFNKYLEGLSKVNKSIANVLDMRLHMCQAIAIEKKYNSVLEQVLTEDDLDENITIMLLNSVTKNIHLVERYYNLIKRKLNKRRLNYYDISISSSFSKKLSFEESLDYVKKALILMGKDYMNYLEQILDLGCLDVFPKKNKVSGGYHFRNYIKPMILMNFNPSYNGMFTIAHELGHAVNGMMIKDNQEYQNFHFSAFLSEFASLTNENILNEYLIANSIDSEEKMFLLERKMQLFVNSIFMATMHFEFNHLLYTKIQNGENLTATEINNSFYELFKKYNPGLIIDENLKYLWQTRLHLFYGQYRYYNFQYATGQILADKVANDIFNNKNGMLEKYLAFLKIGGSMPTLKSLETLGITFNDTTLFDEALEHFNKLMDQYEKILKEEKD